jgi:alpha,alpha-trehalose phosphorylase
MAAEVGQLELAYNYVGEAALIDLQDIHQNSRDGLHIASLAGAWIALVAGFGGMRDHSARWRSTLPCRGASRGCDSRCVGGLRD